MSSDLPEHGSTEMGSLAGSIGKIVPMLCVPDIPATLDWYTAIGFKELGRYEEDGFVNWGMLSFGKAQIMLKLGESRGANDLSLWLYTDRVDDLYRLLSPRQHDVTQAAPADDGRLPGIAFVEDLYHPFYGGRQFSIRDLNGYVLVFLQPSAERGIAHRPEPISGPAR